MKWNVSETESNWQLNVAEFLDPSLKMLLCTKTSPVLCENQSFILLFQNVATFIKSYCVFLWYFLHYGEAFSISLLDGCYHYLVFMDPVGSMVVQRQNYL